MYVNIPVPWSIWVRVLTYSSPFGCSICRCALFVECPCRSLLRLKPEIRAQRSAGRLPWNLTHGNLVGDWTTHLKKYTCQIGSFLQVRVKIKNYLKPPARYPLDLHPYITSNCQFTTSIFRLGSPELNLYLQPLLGGEGRSKISNIMLLCNFANHFLISMHKNRVQFM